MAKLTNLSETSRKAVNRMPVLSEKDKRLLHTALDAEAALVPAITDFVKTDGTTPLTADWDAGSVDITNDGRLFTKGVRVNEDYGMWCAVDDGTVFILYSCSHKL